MSVRLLSQLASKLHNMLPKVVFVLGGPGAGKGTQCEKIVKEYGFVHLSAGELLREERQRPGSQYGEMIEEKMKNGQIVPVEVTCSLIEAAMKEAGTDRFLVDGFPRNKDNLDGWERAMSAKAKVLFVLFFDCSKDTCVERVLNRGAAGSGRLDDNLESLKKRFDTYLNDTMPIINHYKLLDMVQTIDASESPEKVFESVKKVFDSQGLGKS